MALKKSISGFRGTIGGKAGANLTPVDIVSNVAGYGAWLLETGAKPLVVIGRDGRPSGPIVKTLTAATLQSLGIDVIDLDFATTPTVEVAVKQHDAGGGIILSASHNPKEYNALKLLNGEGEFISAAAGARLMEIAELGDIEYAAVDDLGKLLPDGTALQHHISLVLAHPLVEVEAIRKQNFRIVLDAVNSVGAIAIPALCRELNVVCEVINGELNGEFAHNPEPLPENMTQLIERMETSEANLGVAVDPDVDRLALIGPGGRWIGEEYTLAVVADYVLSRTPGPVVSNLSSSRVVADVAKSYGHDYHAAAVGEVNVVEKMKAVGAVIGGEGNGGIIDPALHYGRDSLIGLALVLSHLATSGKTINELRDGYPHYEMIKDKKAVADSYDLNAAFVRVKAKFSSVPTNEVDGLKLDFPDGWVHLRASNTEPIVRVYAEAPSVARAKELAGGVMAEL
ncbi:phosphoglucosamine mutase [Neolewinella antarctica]|uniref:Phosphomannomutase n=1 Tax=Neolewinella antarctica TaxID=442734 RepID=A0ABX0X8F9_9BACT|nr:phosphoglucosamine mutase [Neolewinella antarctica]NJC25112.1 phosphomannomutase [Neolewinella antarctica]